MNNAIAVVNMLLFAGYMIFCFFCVKDMIKESHSKMTYVFGTSLLAVYLTCGLHHLDHAIHTLIDPRQTGVLELITNSIQLVFAYGWVYLRMERVFGGKGDRKLKPRSDLYVGIIAAYIALVIGAAIGSIDTFVSSYGIMPNLLVFATYMIIAINAIKTQVKRKVWSLSALGIAGYFINCGVSHFLYAFYLTQGAFKYDMHGLIIDWFAFLFAVVHLMIAQGIRPVPVVPDMIDYNTPEDVL